jgi:hypothetical protein
LCNNNNNNAGTMDGSPCDSRTGTRQGGTPPWEEAMEMGKI